MSRLLPCVLGLCLLAGCGGSGSSSKFSEKELLGKWDLDFQDLANEQMGPKMGPNFYNEMYSKLSSSVEFKPNGEAVLSERAGPSSSQSPGTWKVVSAPSQPLKINLTLKERTDDVPIKFIDADTIQIPPKMISAVSVKRVQLTRVKK